MISEIQLGYITRKEGLESIIFRVHKWRPREARGNSNRPTLWVWEWMTEQTKEGDVKIHDRLRLENTRHKTMIFMLIGNKRINIKYLIKQGAAEILPTCITQKYLQHKGNTLARWRHHFYKCVTTGWEVFLQHTLTSDLFDRTTLVKTSKGDSSCLGETGFDSIWPGWTL